MNVMQEEMKSLQKNNMYKLVELSKGKRMLKYMWIVKLKKDENDKLVKDKARLVVKVLNRRKVSLLLKFSHFLLK